MKIELKIERDSHNSPVSDDAKLEVECFKGNDIVWLTLDDRIITVNINELMYALKFAEES